MSLFSSEDVPITLQLRSPRSGMAFPDFKQPELVGHLCYNTSRQWSFDKSQLRYYVPPLLRNPPCDLSVGYDQWIAADPTQSERLNIKPILAFIRSHGVPETASIDARKKPDIVCWRGVLTRLMTSPYKTESSDSWCIVCVMFKGTCYLIEMETDISKERRAEMNHRSKLMTYWGHRFESYCCVESHPAGRSKSDVYSDIRTDMKEPLNTNAAYCAIVWTKIARRHSVLIAGEVDACCEGNVDGNYTSPSPPNLVSLKNFVEVKTNRSINNERTKGFFKKKLLSVWAQSFLLGVPRVIFGYRDDDGFVCDTECMNTLHIPRYGRGVWDGAVAMNSADIIIAFMRQRMMKVLESLYGNADDACITVVFDYRADLQRVDSRIPNAGELPSHISLPNWFTAPMDRHAPPVPNGLYE